ncbi:acetylxylan esterase [Bacillus horti]|uniref:Cephalosporin-C deacetylase n=1 Tax=Caldalkalibacillus horti TaxID=77523 RepID=A0ABT9VXX9_9BACI|nr:alpha/beta fold hydrolase [Bacillus horti]MDQ0165847.1 cephalosporin-C deacetylase [Bacillus horti]
MYNDMSLEGLRSYQGSSPKPTDFDSYWSRALKELDEQSLEYEHIPANIQTDVAECFHLYFTGVGGARVYAKLVKPKQIKEHRRGIVMFHGYSGNSGDWFDKIAYAAQGFTVMALDCRGQGGLSEDNLPVKGTTLRGHIIRGIDNPDPYHLYFRYVFLDTAQAVRILMSMEDVDEDRVGVMGASQGGALAIASAALEPRIKMVAATYPFLSDYKRMYELDIKSSAYAELVDYFKFFDPLHEREKEVFERLGYIDIQNLADRITAEVLWITGLTDLSCPPSTQFAAYNKIRSKKEMLIYHEYGHEFIRGAGDQILQKMLTL